MKWMMMALVAGCLAVVGYANAAPQPTSYGIAMVSKLDQGRFMSLKFDGSPACFGKIAAGSPVQCKTASVLPRMVKVEWGRMSNWETPSGHDPNVPAGWKTPKGFYQQKFLVLGDRLPPRWFRSGDIIVFAINKMHRLSVTYQCHRPGSACVSFPPVTVVGVPQGVASIAP
ncbi:MAG TPA: hypothetical protein VFL63_10545 [Rhodanobacteraceae bacterium]|jgi:hypothetical protein|nr:hypothetical protein [Rhodanobacteraceae bacterium]